MVDQKKVQEAIKLLLEGIGEDTDREGLKETPERIGRMYEEICGGMDQDAGQHLSMHFFLRQRQPSRTHRQNPAAPVIGL